MDSWEDKNTGQKRNKLRVVGENMQFLGSREGGGGGGGGGGQDSGSRNDSAPRQEAAPSNAGVSDAPAAEREDDDIPF